MHTYIKCVYCMLIFSSTENISDFKFYALGLRMVFTMVFVLCIELLGFLQDVAHSHQFLLISPRAQTYLGRLSREKLNFTIWFWFPYWWFSHCLFDFHTFHYKFYTIFFPILSLWFVYIWLVRFPYYVHYEIITHLKIEKITLVRTDNWFLSIEAPHTASSSKMLSKK